MGVYHVRDVKFDYPKLYDTVCDGIYTHILEIYLMRKESTMAILSRIHGESDFWKQMFPRIRDLIPHDSLIEVIHILDSELENGATVARYEGLLNWTVENLELRVRTTNYLKAAKIFFIRDLVYKTKPELLKINKMTKDQVEEIIHALSVQGLKLRE
jgi:Bacterial RNA polymerase, alpha chain C terminal domain